jgi:hypothetical protein
MARRLARGIHFNFRSRLILATNHPNLLSKIQRQLRGDSEDYFDIELISFPNRFPVEARFQSASQKTALYSFLASQTGYSIVLDLDMVCLFPFGAEVDLLIQDGVPIVTTFQSRLSRLTPTTASPRIYIN